MQDVPEEWRPYARLQASLQHRKVLDDQSWGLEAGLDHCLDQISAKASSENPQRDADRAVASGRSREHHRGRLRLAYLANEDTLDPEPTLEARDELRELFNKTDRDEQMILLLTGLGYDAAESASALGTTPAAWRQRLCRLRRQVAA